MCLMTIRIIVYELTLSSRGRGDVGSGLMTGEHERVQCGFNICKHDAGGCL